MKKLFGTDGIRGEAGEYPLDTTTVTKIGAAVATVLGKRLGRPAKLVSGRDTRESGPWIEEAFHAGVRSVGAEGESAGVITTPGIAFLTREFNFDAGIVISASHNPFHDNGIKVFLPSGRKLDEESERKIEEIVHSSDEIPGNESAIVSGRESEFKAAYLDYLSAQFEGLDLNGVKIVADCANGAASGFAADLFRRFGADVTVINDRPDGKNINLDCGSLHLEHLQKAVVEHHADFGVAFDGDADRALFVDEKGSIVDGDATLWILANHLKERGKLASGKVVATVMSNIGLESALRNESIELIRASVGDKYVLEELLSSGAEIGGEQSGHIILPDTSLVGDGMMTAMFVLSAMKRAKFSELCNGFVQFPQVLVNVKVKEKRPFDEVAGIASAARDLEAKLGTDGRLLLRYSGTENLARVMIEGKDQAEITVLANDLAAVIKQELG
jgi:phosphoglucosamine mutase